ncbi:MAG: glycosyl transferase [Clostridiales bacterium]|nr:glycosyl transferase [Clostridiales bacterium]
MLKRINRRRKNTEKKVGQAIKLGFQILFLIILLVIIIVIIYFYQTYGKGLLQLQSEAKQMVRASTPETFREAQTSLVYDSEGDLISTLKYEKDVYYINFEDIPSAAIEAMLVSEDRKFLEHDGVDYLANVRAALALIKNKGKITQGASTITQQLARNVFLSHEVTYERKTEEIFIAMELEKKYSKYDILEFYFNNIYFANGHYGIQAASFGYFGKSIKGLSLSQIVFLCTIPNNPNRYNPITNYDNAIARRDRILEQMLMDQVLDQEEYEKAINEKIELSQSKITKKNYVETYVYHSAIKALMAKQGFKFQYFFADSQEKKLYDKAYDELYYGIQQNLFRAGYRIYTSIDMEKQELLQKSVDETLEKFTETNEEGIYKLQGAAVCIDNDNGRVVAIVGGRGQEISGYTLNRAYQSFRQPGSAIKPLIVYTPAFERGYTPDSIVIDEKFEGGPSNAGKSYAGEMKLQRAIEVSKNTIAWKLFEELKPSVALSYLLEMNFAKLHANDYYPAASLGGFTIGVSPVEMAAAFATLENGGYYREPTCIVKIMDAEGNEIVGDNVVEKAVYKSHASHMMTEALVGVIKNGTAKGLGLKNTISAGKTGTTDEKKDGWFVGYTPYYTTSTWVGYDLPQTVEGLSGSSYPGLIWHTFMDQIHTHGMNRTFSY